MSFEIRTIANFDRQAKRLAKHYESFRDDLKRCLKSFRRSRWQVLTSAVASEK